MAHTSPAPTSKAPVGKASTGKAKKWQPTSLAVWSVPVALFVLGLKYAAFHLTGSVALYSDALESIVNVIAAIAALVAIRVAMKPADESHPFGHNKAEYFSAVIEGALIMVAATLIVLEAWPKLLAPQMGQEMGAGLILNFAATALNAIWAVILLRWGRRLRSPALQADGVHLMSDVITSVGVLVGLMAALITGLPILDPLLALVVACHILWQGWKLMNSSIQGLMDVGVDFAEVVHIRQVISTQAQGAIEAHDLRTRVAGRLIFIEFHLVVPDAMTVGAAHSICDRIEAALGEEFPHARVVIHIEPESEAKLPPGTTALPFA